MKFTKSEISSIINEMTSIYLSPGLKLADMEKRFRYVNNDKALSFAQKIIQKQKETYKTLLESDNTLRLALEVGNMGIWDWDIATNKFSWSNGSKPLYGLRRGNIDGTLEEFLKSVHPSDSLAVFSGLKEALKNQTKYESEFRILWLDGSVHWILKKGRVISDSQGKPVRMIGIGMDITERKVTEEALKMSEKKFKSIFNTSLDGILITDNRMKIIDTNQSSSELFLLSKEKLLGKNLSEVVSPEIIKEFIRNWKKLQKEGSQRGEIDILRGDGKFRTVEYSATSKFFQERSLFVLRDITQRKEEEKQREHLLGIASHELRTPLASIRAFVEILKRYFSKIKDQNILQYLSKIDDKTKILGNLINDLLDVARIREGKLEFYYEIFDFDKFLDELIGDIQITTTSHKIFKKGELKRNIITDRNRLSQVIINLLKNALKYSPDSDKVIVEVKRDEKDVILSIQDFGIGVPVREHKKIFDIFYRNETAKKRKYGLGLGLYISSEIISKMGGSIWLKSNSGKGSTFYVKLPLIPKNEKKHPDYRR